MVVGIAQKLFSWFRGVRSMRALGRVVSIIILILGNIFFVKAQNPSVTFSYYYVSTSTHSGFDNKIDISNSNSYLTQNIRFTDTTQTNNTFSGGNNSFGRLNIGSIVISGVIFGKSSGSSTNFFAFKPLPVSS